MVYLKYFLLMFCLCGVDLDKDSRIIDEEVSLIEYNHVYNKNNSQCFDQVIFYHCHAETGEFHVRGFFLVRADSSNKPPLSNGRGWYVVEYVDDHQKILRRIKSKIYKETWTTSDPEQEDKLYIEDQYRYHLIKPPSKLNEEENALPDFYWARIFIRNFLGN